MGKDSFWFKHDSTAGRGLRMRKMAHIHGHWGKGVYWDVIEILRDQSGYKFDCDETSLQMLADIIGVKDEPKFMSWFADCIKFELFIIDGKSFFSEVLCSNMEVWETKKTNGGKGGRRTKTESATGIKPDRNRNDNRNGSIREDKSIVEEIREDLFKKVEIIENVDFEEIFIELVRDQVWQEGVAMTLKFKLPHVQKMLVDFLNELKLKEDYHKGHKKIKEHFVNWIKKDREKGINSAQPKKNSLEYIMENGARAKELLHKSFKTNDNGVSDNQ